MNLKLEKGITLLSLMVIVCIILVLGGVTVRLSADAINTSKLEDIKTDMISIKTRAKIVAEQYNFKDIDNLVGNAITDDEAQRLGLTNSENIRKWSDNDLRGQNLGAIEGEKYVVSYDLENPNNCEVYYLEGYEGMYSLTELQGL